MATIKEGSPVWVDANGVCHLLTFCDYIKSPAVHGLAGENMGALFCAVCLEGYRIIPDFPYDESPEISVKSSLFLEEAILWAFATGLENPAFCSLEKKKKEIYLGATIRALFPGIIFDSFVEFGFLRPALMETFPHFKHGPVGSKILSEKMLEVPALLETKGREWRDNMEWRRKFSQLLTP